MSSDESLSALDRIFDATYAQFWEAELSGHRLEADVARIRAVCDLQSRASVLDLGCAYGRIANRLALEGHRVTALDRSTELLELASRRASEPRPSFVCADMRTFVAPAAFDVAILWFSTLGYFSDRDNEAVIKNAFDSLRPGGRLAVETRNWDRIHRSFEPWTVRESDGNLLIERHEFMPLSGRQETTQLLVLDGRQVTRRYFLRRYTGVELVSMYTAAGFENVKLFGEDLEPLSVLHERVIAVGHKPEA